VVPPAAADWVPAASAAASWAGTEAGPGTDGDAAGVVPDAAEAGPGRAAEVALAAGVLAVGLAVGELAAGRADGAPLVVGTAVAEGARVAATAGRSADGTASADAGAAAEGPPSAFFPSRFCPGASPDWPRSEASTGRPLSCWVTGAVGSPGSGAPPVAWDAGTPVARTSTAPIAAAAEPRRIPPWIPVRDIESSDLL
jgi:hypothetical protein